MSVDQQDTYGDELPPGAQLCGGQYVIEGYLNAGGFGITYLARDSLNRRVVIKECFPSAMCHRTSGSVRLRSSNSEDEFAEILELFEKEARALAELQHPYIVGVHQIFHDNGTAYMAMDYVAGRNLLEIIEDEPNRFTPEDVRQLLIQCLEALDYIHSRDILHRDISPDNILLDEFNNPVLIDFGAAREEAVRVSRVLSAQHTVKDGYSPQEFYIQGSKQTLSSDLYALAATIYHLISARPPPVSQLRLSSVAEDSPDPYQPLLGYNRDYDRFFLGAIDKCLSIFPKDRLQTAHDWLDEIDEPRRRKAALQRAKKDQQIEDTILALVEETNKEVLPGDLPYVEGASVPKPAPADQTDASVLRPPRPFPELRDNPTQIVDQRIGAKQVDQTRSFISRILGSPFKRRRQDEEPQSDIVGKAGR